MIESVDQIEEWFKFAVNYAKGTKVETRRPFDTAAARVNRLFTPAFTDDMLVLFDSVTEKPPAPIRPRPARRG